MGDRHIDESESLLREFVRLAPAEWGATILRGHEQVGVCLMPEMEPFDIDIWPHNDKASGKGLIELWDYLEGRFPPGEHEENNFEWFHDVNGYGLRLSRTTNACSLDAGIGPLYAPSFGKQWESHSHGYGKTRIECLVRACVAVWEADAVPADKDIVIEREPTASKKDSEEERMRRGCC